MPVNVLHISSRSIWKKLDLWPCLCWSGWGDTRDVGLGYITVRCRYHVVNFHLNPHEKYPIARPLERDMGCMMWVQTVIYILAQSMQWCIQYDVILDRVVSTLDCILLLICICVHVMNTKTMVALLDYVINTFRPRQNGRRFKHIFLNENVRISIQISLTFVPKGPINNIPALVQTMSWRRSGDKPLSEPMMVSLLTDICVTRAQWVKN